MNLKIEDLRRIALNVISYGQNGFKIDANDKHYIYALAFNDGCLEFLNAIIEAEEYSINKEEKKDEN